MKYQINSTGAIILADQAFMDAQYPNDYTLLPDDPSPAVQRAPLSKREFLKLFTPAEYGAIKTATNSNSTVDYYWQQFLLAEFISMDDPDTLGGLQLLESIGLLAAGRAAELSLK